MIIRRKKMLMVLGFEPMAFLLLGRYIPSLIRKF
jgi:hypothetical protein